MNNIKVLSINISTKKGTIKEPVNSVYINKYGITNDAHSGSWHRQISLLGIESIHRFEQILGRTILPGEFAENITTEGMNLYETQPLDQFVSNEVILEVTQIGKQCHGDGCSIFQKVGQCVMPKEGIFTRVLKSGYLSKGNIFTYKPKVFNCRVITLSDRAFFGEYNDRSGPTIVKILENYFVEKKRLYNIKTTLLPDDKNLLEKQIKEDIEQQTDIIITTGGTGISKRDITIEVIKPLLEKEIPGIMEYIRFKYGSEKPNALLSRSIAGVSNQSLIFALPGSVKAVNEYMNEIVKSLQHMIYMIYGLDIH